MTALSRNIESRFLDRNHFSMRILIVALPIFYGAMSVPTMGHAADSLSRTESNCTIGMAKGDAKAECRVPIPAGCSVAQFPGYPEPWADISKGGGTTCEFNQKQTDWKTSIVGTCQACKTEQCTGRFIVMFNCSNNIPPANQAPPKQK